MYDSRKRFAYESIFRKMFDLKEMPSLKIVVCYETRYVTIFSHFEIDEKNIIEIIT